MSQVAAVQPTFKAFASFRRFTVAEYHKLIRTGILNHGEPIELLEGWMVQKMTRGPIHDGSSDALEGIIRPLLPAGWMLRGQKAVTLSDSEPEPDAAVVRGNFRSYFGRHPGPADIGLLIEVSNTSLDRDRLDKTRIYARAGIPVYWVVNLDDPSVEVYTLPSGPTADPAYARCDTYRPGDAVPLVLDGQTVGTVPAADLLP